ncbi:MAG: PilZ domain-containing protein [Phycisphaeraceae bacterium]|nr:PilZ domain-containing protein [Phycisphaeraceae bacterium]
MLQFQPADPSQETRVRPRLKIPAMYTLLRVRRRGTQRYCWTGYIYDISGSGMRFELDKSLEPGEEIDVRAMLPGQQHVTFRAEGKVIRMHDDDEGAGPCRMGMVFTSFQTDVDRRRLEDYLQERGLKAA